MSELSVAVEAERYLQAVVEAEPQEGECLVCFVTRMVEEHGCDTTYLWARRFRDLRSPTATGLEKRYWQRSVTCDCLIGQSYQLVRELLVRDVHSDELEPPVRLPPCAGVRRTSTQHCANWERERRP
jgi:uncharacterized protein DUF2695